LSIKKNSLYYYLFKILAPHVPKVWIRPCIWYITLKQRCCYAYNYYHSNHSIVNVTITIATTNNVSIKEEEKSYSTNFSRHNRAEIK